jgi:SAM-dependent methyltransferase
MEGDRRGRRRHPSCSGHALHHAGGAERCRSGAGVEGPHARGAAGHTPTTGGATDASRAPRRIEVITGAVRDRLRALFGDVVELVVPSLAREIDEGRSSGRALRLKRAIVHARLRRAESRNDAAALERALQARWRSDVNDDFYAAYVTRFVAWFHGPHYRVIDALADAVAVNPRLVRLVEAGCGDGRALAHLAERLPGLQELVGLDLNARIIARNVRVHGDRPRLRFEHSDARVGWPSRRAMHDPLQLRRRARIRQRAQLAAILARLGRHRDTAVALVEPVDPRHNLTSDAASHPHGQERSFSHNHVALLAAAAFTIRFAEELTLHGIRWMMVLAVSDHAT